MTELCLYFRETAIQEPTSKSPRKFSFSSSPLSIGKRNEKPVQPVKKKDDQFKLSSLATKDNKFGAKGSRLLPVITRQKKAGKQEKNDQSQAQESTTNQMSEPPSNQSSAEALLSNQKLKRIEEAQKRKELLEGGADRQKGKEDKVEMI